MGDLWPEGHNPVDDEVAAEEGRGGDIGRIVVDTPTAKGGKDIGKIPVHPQPEVAQRREDATPI
jgi:hypothetical protein